MIGVTELSGERVSLREFSMADAVAIFSLIDTNRMHLSRHHNEISMMYPTLQTVVRSIVDPKPRRKRFGIRNKVGDYVGSINLETLTNNPRVGEIGYYLGEQYQGNGYMVDAIMCLTAHAFLAMDIRLLFAYVYPENIPSQRVIAKAGYVYTRDEVLGVTDTHDNLIFQRYEKRPGV